jgi:maltose alpha-D-glucosyltransferase/alpha-amylase
MVTPEERRFMWDFYAPEPRMPHNLGIRRRLAPLLGNSLPRIQVAHSILLTIIGSPFLYYGDEIGMGDNIELEDRDGVRTPMQWDGTQNAGFSPATPDSLFAPVITEGEFEYRRVNVEAQRGDPGSLLNWLRLALQLRREHPAFSRGELTLLDFRQRSVLAYLRQHASRSVLVLNNLSDQPVQVELGKIETGPGGLFDLFRGEEVGADLRTTESLELEPYGFRWLRVD